MPSYIEGDRELSRSLQSLLRMFPNELDVQRRVVLTTTPRLWSRSEVAEETLILDLSTLLGVGGMPWPVSEGAIVEGLVEQLLERGWRAEQVIPHYRPDLRSGAVIDIALFDQDKTWVVAIETKRREFMSLEGVRRAFEQLSTSANARWLCVTDGERFHLINSAAQENRVTQEAPSPSDLGLGMADVGNNRASPKPSNVFSPTLAEELQTAMSRHHPQGVIVDQNLPFGMSAERGSPRQATTFPLSALLPEDLPPLRGRVEALHTLMAWAGSIPSVTTISGIVPSSFMRAQAYEWLREYLQKRLRLCGIIELPADIHRPSTLPTTLFYLGGNRDKAYFDVLSSRGDLIGMESRPWFDSLSKWMKGKEPTTGFAANVDSRTLWAAGPNDPELEKIYERLGRIGELVTLDELCEIRRGIPLGRGVEEVGHGIPYLQGRSLREGYLNIEDARMVRAENIPDWAFLRSGDILLSEVVSERSSVIINQSNELAVLSPNIIVLRRRSDRVSAEYLVEYLNSSTAQKFILANASRFGGLHRISHSALRKLQVPVFEPELFHGLSETKEIEQELRNKADELESTRRCLFDSANEHAFRERISSLKRVGKILATSLKAASSLDFQIANFYPFPVAYSFRLLASKVNPAELYREQLRVAENLLAFIASVSLSLLQRKDFEEAEIDVREYWQGGISPGDWRAISARTSKIFSTYKDAPLAAAINGLNIGSEKRGFGPIAKLLIESLNDHKHHRGPSLDEDYVRASKDVGTALIGAMERISFFTEYPIRQIQDINPRRNSEKVDLKCLRYTGDHPGHQPKKLSFINRSTKEIYSLI
jgi:hypothetical protein